MSKVSSLIISKLHKEFRAERTDRKINSYYKTLFFKTFPVYHSLKSLLLENIFFCPVSISVMLSIKT